MPTPCWLKHLCSIRALVPVSFFFPLFLFISVFLADSLERESRLCNPGNISLFLLWLSHRGLRTTRFRSIKGPTLPYFLVKKKTKKLYARHCHFKRKYRKYNLISGFPGGSAVKNLPAVQGLQKMTFPSLGQ